MQTLPLSPGFSSPPLAMAVVQLKHQGDHTLLTSNVHLEVAAMEVPPCFTDSSYFISFTCSRVPHGTVLL